MKRTRLFVAAILALIMTVSSASASFAAKPGSGGGSTPPAKSVCIDAGHGGTDEGTSNGGILEKDLNLSVAQRLNDILAGMGYKTYMTRTTDVTLSKEDRYTFCNNTDATVLLSVHHNGSTDHTVDYSMGLYKQPGSQKLAIAVGQEVANEFGNTFQTELFANMMIMKSNMPGIINEGYFLTNDNRLAQLEADYSGMVDREAGAMARGLDSYYASF